MRKLLLGTTALAAAASLTANAALADVSLSGMIEWSYNSRSSNVASNDGTTFDQVSEMQVNFSNKTDSGLTLGMQVDMNTMDGSIGHDETSLSISGGFGKIVLGENDAAAESYIIDESDLIAEDAAPSVMSMSVSQSSSLKLEDSDNNKISYHLPAMGGLTVGISHTDGGAAATSTDTNTYGAKYAMEAAGAAITLAYTNATTEVSGAQDKDSDSMGVKIVSGDVSMIISQSSNEAANEDVTGQGASISYKMPNGMTVGAYTFKSEDDLDTGEEYSRSGLEVQYTIASGLTAYINVDDYDYKEGTSNDASSALSVDDSGTNSKLTIKATF